MRILGKLSLAFIFSATAFAGPASADDKEEARRLFESGLDNMQAGKYEEGCPALDKSLRLDPYPGTLFTTAECFAKWGRAGLAVTRYKQYLELYDSLPKDKQAKQGSRNRLAKTKLLKLEKLVAEITLVLPSDAPEGTEIKRDGNPIESKELSAPLYFDPGEHVFTTKTPGADVHEQRVTLEKGEKKTITLEIKLPPPPDATSAASASSSADPPPPPGSLTPRRIITYAAGGLGALGLITGAVTGSLMLVQADTINNNCQGSTPGSVLCNPEGAQAGNDAKLYGTIATVGFAVALAGLGAGATLFVLDMKNQESSESGRSNQAAALIQGLSVRALPLGPMGTTLSVQGAF